MTLPSGPRPPRLIELPDTRSLELLNDTSHGHIVVTHCGFPVVRPAGHVLEGDSLVIRAALAPDLLTTIADEPSAVAYHVHEIDPGSGSGWEVTVPGFAEPVPPHAAARYRDSLPGWTHGGHDTVLRLAPLGYHGFRLGHPLTLVPEARFGHVP
ncbi:pyridoxamine 5'-phosphate oxidase family protein [Yinghuangia sp. ASG 101]|uniref:pyridoxamine 5'-phosphate oxidase family protein n=1 Tax=Yinghuangia sp. ASG 101 TaxID=2896848 RepID=UPI001E43EC4C|nr:pyridoxamine 5'-phosphate oxidase family protein [Yinghuangia sp. ASG 101]UGQ11888.1 pyridoxamine 5'-phosphate oxidase family protein [Yinghuangia sp. ASG 101]